MLGLRLLVIPWIFKRSPRFIVLFPGVPLGGTYGEPRRTLMVPLRLPLGVELRSVAMAGLGWLSFLASMA